MTSKPMITTGRYIHAVLIRCGITMRLEKELAARLRKANQTERRSLYHVVYDERLRRIPAHPLLTKAQDPWARDRAASPTGETNLDFLEAGRRVFRSRAGRLQCGTGCRATGQTGICGGCFRRADPKSGTAR